MTITRTPGAGDHLGIEEQLLMCTVRIVATAATDHVNMGTGFVIDFSSDEAQIKPYVLTNKHVVHAATKICLRLRKGETFGRIDLLGEPFDVEILAADLQLIEHPDPNVDLVAIPFGPFAASANKSRTKISVIFWGIDQLLTAESAPRLPPFADILMIGYPIGLMDDVNNLPMARRGVTATPVSANFGGRQEFVVDIACFPGSSGSPVVYREFGLSPTGGIVTTGFRLLGLLYAGPSYTARGVVVDVPAPTTIGAQTSTPFMLNLGYCIKADRIMELCALTPGR